MRRPIKYALAAAVCAAVPAIFILTGGYGAADANAPRYKLAAVERGPIARTVQASGKLEAVVTVEVGSQISGIIKTLSADFNSQVKAGQVIARIDPASFEAKVAQAEAELAVARANVRMQRAAQRELEAELDGLRAALAQASEELKRKRSLFARRVVASSAVDTALADHDKAASQVKAGLARLAKQQAQIALAEAQVLEKQAAVKQRRLDLDNTYIRSPVNGVVINRNVDAGQTVAASLQAPVLFTIAQDLSQMMVEVSVDEADIGAVQVGQAATFTVDSFPGTTFHGRVHQVRKAGVEVSNVITYTVVVTADNFDHRLLPGMTANVTLIISQRDDALKVANAALRYRPDGAAVPAAAGRAAERQARMERNIERLAERLKLSAEQQARLHAIYSGIGQKVRALREQGMGREQLAPAIRQLRASAQPRIAALLDPEQLDGYRKMLSERAARATRRGHVWVLDEASNPTAISVVYGISDGTSTEIVEGALSPGQKVIVGTLEATTDGRPTRWRFGF